MTFFIVYLIVGVASVIVLLASDYTDGEFSGFRKAFEVFKSGEHEDKVALANDGAMAVLFWPVALYWRVYKTVRKD